MDGGSFSRRSNFSFLDSMQKEPRLHGATRDLRSIMGTDVKVMRISLQREVLQKLSFA